ncbi:MAG TPA: ABC transporter permease [Terracidiphilus sp.]
MRSIMQDLRYALRQLRSAPGFALTAISVLALGLGANIAVFTLLSGIVLRPLPFAHANRVVAIDLAGPLPYYTLTYANMLQLRDAVGPRLKIGAQIYAGSERASVVTSAGRFQVTHPAVTTGLFDMLGVQPALGRGFREEESSPGKNRVLVIGDDVWHKLYNSDPNVIGRTLDIRQEPYTIVGVLPKKFFFSDYDEMTVWSPMELTPGTGTSMTGKEAKFGSMFARLPEGMTAAQLAADLSRTQAVIAKEVPDAELPANVKVRDCQSVLNETARKPLLLLYAVVIGIWALACLNVASLMLARAVSRTREQAVRAALGASRARLLQQSLIGSCLLSGVGALAGLLLGQGALKILWRQIERNLPMAKTVHLDWRVTAFLAGLTLLTAIISGGFPALLAMRRDVRGGLNGVTTTSSAGANRTREVLVVGQLALTLVFLVGAGLFLRTIHALRQVPLGFAQQNVLTGGIILNGGTQLEDDDSSANEPSVVQNYYAPLLERLRAVPGVQVAALSSVLPLRREMSVSIITSLDHKDEPMGKQPQADGRISSPGLVEALGIPMVRGRFFAESDSPTSPAVVVVNQAFANKYLPNQDPVGHTVSMSKKGRFADIRIVGVISDTKQTNVTDPTKPEIYFCLAQTVPGTPLYGIATAFIQVAIRGRISADLLRGQFDKALHEVAPDATTTEVKTIHEAVEDSFGSQTLIARLLESFAGLALMIASVGLYGLLSFAVVQRTREIGVRIALGAPQSGIVVLVLRRALMLVAVGLACGGAMAWFAARFADSYVFGVKPHDALTFTAVAAVLAAASFFAAWLPARRAAAVDPILALRSE